MNGYTRPITWPSKSFVSKREYSLIFTAQPILVILIDHDKSTHHSIHYRQSKSTIHREPTEKKQSAGQMLVDLISLRMPLPTTIKAVADRNRQLLGDPYPRSALTQGTRMWDVGI